MEKTTHISLASMSFQLTETAFEKLRAYLESLRAHFRDDADEIMRDIESRVAEKFISAKKEIIGLEEVTAVIEEIGSPSQFDDEDELRETPRTARKKLYRDVDGAILGGVAAGIAAYFSIDPIIPRLLFLLSIFFGGTGILLYVILWLIIPEAKTASQKLEMRGSAVNLEGIARVVKERVEEAQESGVVQRAFDAFGRLITRVFRVFGKIFGAVVLIGIFFAIIGLSIAAGVILTNWDAPYNDFPLRGAVSDSLLTAGFASGYLVILIPLILIFALCLRLLREKSTLPSSIGFGLIGIWALAVISSGVIAANAAGQFYEHTRTSPDYQRETHALEVSPFTGIMVRDEHITLKSGDTHSVTVTGRAFALDTVVVEVVDGTLNVQREDRDDRLCIFCREAVAEITVTAPDIDTISIEDGVLFFDDYRGESITAQAAHGSIRGKLTASDVRIIASDGSIRPTISADTLTLEADSSYVDMRGSVRTAHLTVKDSTFQADELKITDATLAASSSHVILNVTGAFDDESDLVSTVTNIARE